MPSKTLRVTAAAVVAVSAALVGGTATATAATYESLVLVPPASTVRNDATFVYGGYFMPGQDIVVDQLGYFDYGGDGLLSDHQVGIWYQSGNGTGKLLASTTVSAGTGATLENGYRWVSLSTPITLKAGVYYTIGAEQFAGGDPFLEQSTTTFNPDLIGTWSNTTRGARYGTDMSTEPKNNAGGAGGMYGSANLRTLVAPNTWNGGSGSSGNWSSGANWAGGAAPGFGAGMVQLTFGASARTTSNNDIASASLRGVQFAAGAPAMTLTGNGFTTIGGITNNSANTQTFATGQVTLYSEQTVNAKGGDIVFNAPVNLGGGASTPNGAPTLQVLGLKTTTFNQSVGGSGNLSIGGAAANPRVVFNADNSFTGSVTVNTGVVKLNSSYGLGDPGTLNDIGTPIGATTIASTGSGYAYGVLQVGGNIDSPETLVLAGRDSARNYAQHVVNTDGNNTLSGLILLSNGNGGNHFIRSEAGTKLTLTGAVGLTGTGAHYLYLTGDGDGELALSGSLTEGTGSNKVGVAKQGKGTWTISSAGDQFTPNAWSGGTFVLGGKLVIDRTSDNRDSINGPNNPLTLYGGTLVIDGNAGADTDQVVKSLAVSNGQGQIVMNPGAGHGATLHLNAITRSAGGTLDVSGAGTVTTTTANNTSGMLGTWATVKGTDWAANAAASGEGAIVAVASTAYTADAWGAGLNTDVTADATVADQTTGTVRFNGGAARTVTLSGNNSTSAILVTPNVDANATTITGGTLRALAGTGATELITHVYDTGGLTIGSVIGDNSATNKTSLVKAGPGTLTLTSANTYTGGTTVGYGTLRLGNAAAASSGVVTVWSSDATLALDTDASIGGLAGYGAVDLGNKTLTITGTGEESYYGPITGSGTLVIAKTGNKGQYVYGGSTSFAGQIQVNGGARLYARSQDVFGTTGVGTTVNSGGMLYLMTNMDISEPLTLTGDGAGAGTGALRIYTTQTVTSRGPITLAGPASIYAEYGANFLQTGDVTGAAGTETLSLVGGDPHMAGTISGSLKLGTGGVNVQSGNWFLQGANTYSGPTSVTGNGTVLTVSSIGTPGGAPSNLGQPSAGSANLVMGSVGSYPQLVYTGPGETTARGITLGSNASLTNDGGKLTFTGPVALNPSILVFQGSGDGELAGPVTSSTGVYTVSVNNGGTTNYTSAPTVTISGAGGTGATATATVTSGKVTAVTVTNYGSGFTGRPTVSFSGGGGAGATATANIQTGSLLMTSTGTWTLSGPAAIGGYANINHGTLAFNSASDQSVGNFTTNTNTGLLRKSNTGTLTTNQLRVNAVAIDGGTLKIAPNGTNTGTTVLSSLALSGAGKLDLSDNDMVLKYAAGSSPLASVRAAIASAYHGGAWDGAGITSSSAASNPNAVTGLAAVDNADLLWTSFSGQTITPNAVLVKYTYFGDANLDGKVNADDYALVDRGLAKGFAGWVNGDFNYDGLVNSGDYLLMDRAFAYQSGPLSPAFLAQREAEFGAAYVSQLVASVPEPGTVGAALAAGLVVAGGRRRRHRSAAR